MICIVVVAAAAVLLFKCAQAKTITITMNMNICLFSVGSFLFSGHSILFVGLYNPKGPCEEVQVKHTGKNTFNVNYYIRERGEYTLLVMWGEHHITGSPFAVEVPTKC